MGEGRGRTVLPRLAAVLLAGASLAACASTDTGGRTAGAGPRYPSREGPKSTAPQRPPPQAQGPYKVGKPYQVNGVWYTPKGDPAYDEVGIASWYGDAFQFRPTASGEPFDMHQVSAAHKTLPLQSLVEVTNLDTGRKIQVRINDRGPFVEGRIIDLSRAAAEDLGMARAGLARVRVRYIGIAGQAGPPAPIYASAQPPPRPAKPAADPIVVAMKPIPNPPEPMRAPPMTLSGPAAYEVQAAAFSDPANAERVRRMLAASGEVEIRSLQRDEGLLYRVVVCRLADEAQALAVQERLAAQGFADARVIRPF